MPPKKVSQPPPESDDSSLSEEHDELASEYDDNVDQDYHPTGVLSIPRNASYSLSTLHTMMTNGGIDLDPDYQRGFVWTEQKQSHLIDSIFRNFYVPPVIFHVLIDKRTGDDRRVCIDGKQRLTSVRRFIDGSIPYKDPATGIKYWSPNANMKEKLNNKKRLGKVLPEGAWRRFKIKQIVSVEYYELTATQEREIFNRVQMGMPLSAAEKMAAIISDRSLFASELAKKCDTWPDTVKLADDRNRRLQLMGHFLHGVSTLPDKLTTPVGSVSLERWLRDTTMVEDKAGFANDIDIMLDIANNYADVAYSPNLMTLPPSNTTLHAPKLSPVEFIHAAMLVHMYKHVLKPEKLALAIQLMRRHVRMKHVDIRTNSQVSKSLEDFLIDDLKTRIDAGELGAIESENGKRKRVVNDDDEYTDEVAMDISPDHSRSPVRKRRAPPASAPAPTVGPFASRRPANSPAKPSSSTSNVAMKTSPSQDGMPLPPALIPSPAKPTQSGSLGTTRSMALRGGWGGGLTSLTGAYRKGGQNQ